MSDPHPLLHALSQPGRRSQAIASVLRELIVKDRQVGALDTVRQTRPGGTEVECKAVPREWLDRLAVAAKRGAFERYSIEEIRDRIITEAAANGQ